ncbi:hypothetical protein MKJ01_07685 [Chryseobacterium sp. SSA4.19]|uniref:hypothetical protein n=1 Tax=Chryseobacterium sp. SSA4.19 TaxID=2919915 RepID=UPI001F4E6574|nr:hypothetical protein [Chryseobacterium sp. SSA4.19]MCJ8153644.1 hypothetical protein [Chryseobacterium sp. SSA4.19]
MKKVFLVFAAFILLTSCLPKVALAPEYWNQPSKVGILVNAGPPAKYKEGSQGLLDMAVTSGDKYQEGLNVIREQIKPKEELISLYTEILKSKGKEVVIIDETFDAKTAPKFEGPKAEGKKYSRYDYSNFKKKYNVDELLVTDVHYGFMISYYGMIETGKMAHVLLNTSLVNLNDQSLILSDMNMKNEVLKKWKDNNYENSVQGVRKALDKAKEEEKNVHLK